MDTYAGIGSRKTPIEIQEQMTYIASILKDRYTLRSGGAHGADSAFERGAGDNKEIFLPWRGFNGHTSPFYSPPPNAYAMAEHFHPRWELVSQGARKLMARNSQIIAGLKCEEHVSFVLCWTADGRASGGTGQAIRIAEYFRIPVFNLAFPETQGRVMDFVEYVP